MSKGSHLIGGMAFVMLFLSVTRGLWAAIIVGGWAWRSPAA